MRRSTLLSAVAIMCSTAFGASAQAQCEPPVTPYHAGAVVGGACFPDLGNRATWTTFQRHRVLSLVSIGGIDNAGFEVYGNINSVIHGIVPKTFVRAGRLPAGTFTFRVVTSSPPAINDDNFPYFFYKIYSNNGVDLTDGGNFINNTSPGVYSIEIPRAGGPCDYPTYLVVFLGYHPLGEENISMIVDNFAINGILIHTSSLIDSGTTGPQFCNQ